MSEYSTAIERLGTTAVPASANDDFGVYRCRDLVETIGLGLAKHFMTRNDMANLDRRAPRLSVETFFWLEPLVMTRVVAMPASRFVSILPVVAKRCLQFFPCSLVSTEASNVRLSVENQVGGRHFILLVVEFNC